jgi:hypothetical protein
VFKAIQAGEGYLTVAVFEANPSGNTEDETLYVKRWISLPNVGPVVAYHTVYTGNPLFGPGSSLLILTAIDADIIYTYEQFYRLAYYTDMNVFLDNHTSSELPHVDFVGSSLYYAIILSGIIIGVTVLGGILVYIGRKYAK